MVKSVDKLVAPCWQGFKPYEPGKSIESLAAQAGIAPQDICKLASNENSLPLSDVIRQAFDKSFDQLARYPDGDGAPLKSVLADYYQLAPENITLGTGSNGILDGIARIFLTPGHSAMYSQYSFMIYKLAVQARGADAIEVPATDWGHDLKAFAAAYTQAQNSGNTPRLVFLANPNNPTGTWFSHQALSEFLSIVDAENTLVVLDEAYAEYCAALPEYPQSLPLLQYHANLIITRTFSKAWGLAGLRVGYAIAHPAVTRWLNTERAPFNVPGPGLEVAAAALSDQAFLRAVVDHNSQHHNQLIEWLQRQGAAFIPSVGNFVTVEVPPHKTAVGIFEALLDKGVITRPLGGYGMPQHLRVSIGTMDDMQRLKTHMQSVFES